MNIQTAILDIEKQKLESRCDSIIRWLFETVKSSDQETVKLLCRLIPSRVLDQAAGVLNKHGYNDAAVDGYLDKLEWIRFFVGHEILDDGSPALCWHKYNRDQRNGENMFIDCQRGEMGAKPYWHRCQEITAEKFEDRAQHLTAELALWTLDLYESVEETRYFLYEEARPPEDEVLKALADQLWAASGY